MKKIDIGQATNTLANIGVIVGIAFLVLEISQNNDLLEMESVKTFNDRAIGMAYFQIENPEIIEIGFKNESALAPVEAAQIELMRVSTLLLMEEQFAEIEAGRRRPEELVASWRTIFWSPVFGYGLPSYWERYKPRASEEFVAFIDENIVRPGPP